MIGHRFSPKALRFFRCGQTGTTALEFALIAPILLMLIVGTIEYMVAMYATVVLDSAVRYASRIGRTCAETQNCASNGQSTTQYITGLIQNYAPSLFKPSSINVTFTDYGANLVCVAWPSANPSCSTSVTHDIGGRGDFVVYQATYPWQIYTPLINHFFGPNGVVTITSVAIVKNQPHMSR